MFKKKIWITLIEGFKMELKDYRINKNRIRI